MEIQHLVYCGKREEGTLKVGRVDVLSEWRNIKYYKGLKFQVGKVIPLDVANIIAKDYPSVFKIETKKIEDKDAYFIQLSDIVEECLIAIGDDETLDVLNTLVGRHFKDHAIQDVGGKKEAPAPKKTKTKPKRRREK